MTWDADDGDIQTANGRQQLFQTTRYKPPCATSWTKGGNRDARKSETSDCT